MSLKLLSCLDDILSNLLFYCLEAVVVVFYVFARLSCLDPTCCLAAQTYRVVLFCHGWKLASFYLPFFCPEAGISNSLACCQ